MTPGLVIDASVTIAWLLNEADAARNIQAVFDGKALVAPVLWQLEVSNVILVHERRKRIGKGQATELLLRLDELSIELIPEPFSRTAVALAQLARPHQLTTYDAVYLDLAIRSGAPLFTNDGNLKAAAQRIGVELVTV